MEYRRNEIRAGVFLLVSFMMFAVIVFTVSDIQSLFKQKKEVRVLFLYSDGIEKNAPVRFAGIRVGKVTDVRIATELGDKVELTLSVYKDTVVTEDTKATIRTLGLVGGKYVELAGGSPSAPSLKQGEILTGHEAMKLEDLTRTALDVIVRLKKIAVNLDRVLGDPAMAKSLRNTIQNLQEATANIKVMTANKDEVAQGLKSLPEILRKLDESSANLKDITEKTDKLVGENRKNIDIMIENFKGMSTNVKDLSEDVKANPWKLLRKP